MKGPTPRDLIRSVAGGWAEVLGGRVAGRGSDPDGRPGLVPPSGFSAPRTRTQGVCLPERVTRFRYWPLPHITTGGSGSLHGLDTLMPPRAFGWALPPRAQPRTVRSRLRSNRRSNGLSAGRHRMWQRARNHAARDSSRADPKRANASRSSSSGRPKPMRKLPGTPRWSPGTTNRLRLTRSRSARESDDSGVR